LAALKKRYPIERLALFGSVTREDFDPQESDIDILVEFNGDIGWEYFDLIWEIQDLFLTVRSSCSGDVHTNPS
jgi:predicted nucleotidyltransferase